MNANKNLKFSLLKMKKTGDTIVWLSTIDIMMLYISVRDHARKIKFCSYVHLQSTNKMSDSDMCRRGYYFRIWVLYFSFGID